MGYSIVYVIRFRPKVVRLQEEIKDKGELKLTR